MWVAVGQTRYTIAYSYDGITWNGVTDSSTNIFTSTGIGVAWNGTMWVAVGRGTTYTIAYSYNGINWNGVTDSSTNIFTTGEGVAWNNVVIPSLTLNKNGYGLSNKLDIVADKYYNKGYTNLTLTVNEIPNPTASIIANGSTTLTPQFTNGTTVTINGSSTINGQTIVSNTTYTVSPTMTTRYTLVVTNSIGVQQSASVNVPPEFSSFLLSSSSQNDWLYEPYIWFETETVGGYRCVSKYDPGYNSPLFYFEFIPIFTGAGNASLSWSGFSPTSNQSFVGDEYLTINNSTVISGGLITGTINISQDNNIEDLTFKFVMTVYGLESTPIYLSVAFA